VKALRHPKASHPKWELLRKLLSSCLEFSGLGYFSAALKPANQDSQPHPLAKLPTVIALLLYNPR
jgi:hypothetical protein